MKNQQNMPRIRFLIDYLRPVSDALSYEQYDHPERIVSLLWAKEDIDILADRESLEKALSESVTMPDMGGILQSLYSCLAFIAQEPKELLFGFNNVTYFYNEFSLHKGYQSQRDEYEKMITAQEGIVDSLDSQIAVLEQKASDDGLFFHRLNNRRERLGVEREKLNELYIRPSKLNVYLNILDTCYKPALDRIAEQCRALLPIVGKFYEEWMSVNPPEEKPCSTKSSWDDCFSPNATLPDATKDYFNPGLIIRIYELCNGQQFENCNSTRFIDALNLRTTSPVLKIKEREKVRVCYLINQLWRQHRKELRDEWLSKILDSLGISRKFYNSKHSISPCEYDRSKVSNFHLIGNIMRTKRNQSPVDIEKYSFDIFNHLFFVSCSPQFRWRFSKMPFDIFAKERKVLKA